MRFVDVKNDIAFRKIFGNEKKTQIIISFLNAILKLEGNQRIKEVIIIDPFQLPRVLGEKATIVDVRAKDMTGRQFVVEMQVASVDGFDKRVQYYTARNYSMQIDRGEQYPLLRSTYFVGIMDFDFFESTDYLSRHIIVNEATSEHKLKDIQFTFIELRKFKKEVQELKTLIEKWVFFIKNAENLEVIPENIEDKGLMEAYRDAEKHQWDKEELIAYDNASMAEQDKRGMLTAAEKKGEARGKKQEKLEVVLKMKKRGYSEKEIAEITGLAVDEIQGAV